MKADDPVLVAFARQFRQEILLEAATDGAEAMRSEVLTRRFIESLVEVGELEAAADCYLKQRGIEVSGFGIDDGETLNLITTVHRDEVPPASVTKSEIETYLRRLWGLWERCSKTALHESLEESSDGWSMALEIHTAAPKIRRIRLYVVTDGFAAVEYLEPEMVGGIEVERSIWDIARLQRLESTGMRGEPIEIDFLERFGRPLPCISPELPGADYAAYLAAFPAPWLADIYDEFGARLLEKNVRSFLQFTGKVNRGMRDTLAGQDSHRFFAYNNGISATASGVELVVDESGSAGIVRLRDLQIVNGGQTTASVHRAKRTGIDVGRVSVQAKITEIEGERLDEMVPLISRYANSQNKVSVSDLSSNDPFHIEFESLSRSVWAPATASTMRETLWFYERVRGQYADALNREATPARQRLFKEIRPTSQKFAKTDLAKYENAWRQRPWEVSQGAQKNFTAFMIGLGNSASVSGDVAYYQRLIAKAILWKRTEKIVSAQNFGGYRANIVAYSIAKLSHASQQRLDLEAIWREQGLDEDLEACITELSHLAFELLTDADRPTANVTEWAKREQCWQRFRANPWTLPPAVADRSIELAAPPPVQKPNTLAGPDHAASSNGSSGPSEAIALGGDAYLAISNWAKETQNLTPWDRRFAYTIGIRLKRDQELTPKQIPHAERILAAAREHGFDPGS